MTISLYDIPTIFPITYLKSGSSSMPAHCSACTSPWAGRGGSCRRGSSSLSPRTVYPWWPAGVCVLGDEGWVRSAVRETANRNNRKGKARHADARYGKWIETGRRVGKARHTHICSYMLYTHPAPVGAHVRGHHALEPDAEIADPILCTCANRGGRRRTGSAPK